MKKKTTLELIEQSQKVSLYSISFEIDRTTEFERFLRKFEAEASLIRIIKRFCTHYQSFLIKAPWKGTSVQKDT